MKVNPLQGIDLRWVRSVLLPGQRVRAISLKDRGVGFEAVGWDDE